MASDIFRDFFLGFIKVHILHHAKKEKIYGKEFLEELERHGYKLSYGTLYPIFHKLEKDALIKSEKVNVSGKIRKYYAITPLGEKILIDSKIKIKELIMELEEE